MTNELTYFGARHLVAEVGNIDGKRLQLVEFIDSQQCEIERLKLENQRLQAAFDGAFT